MHSCKHRRFDARSGTRGASVRKRTGVRQRQNWLRCLTPVPFRWFAYCLMSSHFHLVLQPDPGQDMSRILQSLTVARTWHEYQQQGSSGHVWPDRFKSRCRGG
jgi:hypothetical protein